METGETEREGKKGRIWGMMDDAGWRLGEREGMAGKRGAGRRGFVCFVSCRRRRPHRPRQTKSAHPTFHPPTSLPPSFSIPTCLDADR